MILGLIMNGVVGEQWLTAKYAKGGSALDEIIWMIFCTFHFITFGDVYPHTWIDRIFICIV